MSKSIRTITPNEFRINSCELTACISKARDISGWDRKKNRLPKGRGVGMAVGSFVSGAGYPIYRTNLPHAAAIIKVHEDGSAATLYTGRWLPGNRWALRGVDEMNVRVFGRFFGNR